MRLLDQLRERKNDPLSQEAADALSDLLRKTTSLPPDMGNIFDLPEDLLSELSIAIKADLDDQLVTVISAYDGVASLDQILVGLYRKFGVIEKRRFIQNKLYRMDSIATVKGRKGIYALSSSI